MMDTERKEIDALDRAFARVEREGMSTLYCTWAGERNNGKEFSVLFRATKEEANGFSPIWLVKIKDTGENVYADASNIVPRYIKQARGKNYAEKLGFSIKRVPFQFETGTKTLTAHQVRLDEYLREEAEALQAKLAKLQKARTELHMQTADVPKKTLQEYVEMSTPTSDRAVYRVLDGPIALAQAERNWNQQLQILNLDGMTIRAHSRTGNKDYEGKEIFLTKANEPMKLPEANDTIFSAYYCNPEDIRNSDFFVTSMAVYAEPPEGKKNQKRFERVLNKRLGLFTKRQLERVEALELQAEKEGKDIASVFAKTFVETFPNGRMDNPKAVRDGMLCTAANKAAKKVIQTFGSKAAKTLEALSPVPIAKSVLKAQDAAR